MTGSKSRFLSGAAPAALIAALAAGVAAGAATGALAGPADGRVAAGAAEITTRGAETTIRQGSDKVVIDWRSFDIEAEEAVRFLQPGRDSIALNRVLDGLPTNIRGQLQANGNVWIVNRHGIVFHAGSLVDVGGLIATTADISNADFMAGRYRFDRPGAPDARIVNEGEITFAEAGLAAFVAPGAENRGVIAGRMGKVVIAGAETFAIDLAGDGLFAFTMGAGAGGATAKSLGRIHNPGGHILITAATAQGLVESQIAVGGVVEASSASVEGGKIVLSGDGHVEVSGALDVSGASGGDVVVEGATIHLTETARIDASGRGGGLDTDAGRGGEILIGGERSGLTAPTPRLRPARRVLVAAGARLAADAASAPESARIAADGGEIVVWSDEATAFEGAISARGGAAGGDGGFAEISSAGRLQVLGEVDLGAPAGAPGALLLDPLTIFVSEGGESMTRDIFFDEGGDADFVLDPGFLETATAAITLQAANDIAIIADVEAEVGLTFEAGRNIVLAGDIDAPRITLAADADFSSIGGAPSDGIGTLQASGGVLTGRDIAIFTGGDVSLGRIVATRDFTLNAGGDVAQSLGAELDVGRFGVIEGAGDVALSAADNRFAGALSIDAPGAVAVRSDAGVQLDVARAASVSLTAPNADRGAALEEGLLALTLIDSAGDARFGPELDLPTTLTAFTAVSAGGMEVGALSLPGAAADFAAAGPISFTGAFIAGGLTADGTAIEQTAPLSILGDAAFTAEDAITLEDPLNDFAGTTSIGAGAAASLVAVGDVALGAVDAPALTLSAANAGEGAASAVFAPGLLSLSLTDTLGDAAAPGAIAAPGTLVDFTFDAAGALSVGALSLAGVEAAFTAGGALSFDGAASFGALAVDAASVAQTAPIGVAGAAGFTTPGALNLADPANVFGGGLDVAASGGATIAAAGPVALGAVAAPAFSLSAANAGAVGVFAPGLERVSFHDTEGDAAPDIALTLPADLAFFEASSVGALNVGALDFPAAEVVLTAEGPLDFAVGARFGALTAAGAVISQGAPLTVGGPAAFVAAGAATLDAENVFEGPVSVAAGAAALTAAGPLTLGALDLAGDGAFTSGGAIMIADPGEVDGALSLTAMGDVGQSAVLNVVGPVGITADGAVTLEAANAIGGAVSIDAAAAALTTTGALTLGALDLTTDGAFEAGGDLTLAGAATVGGALRLTASGAASQTAPLSTTALTLGGGDFRLEAAGNDIAALTVAGARTVSLVTGGEIALGAVAATGSFALTAANAGAGGDFAPGLGAAAFTDTEGAMTIGALTLGGAAVSLATPGALSFDGAAAFGALTAEAASVAQTAPISVAGLAAFTAPGGVALARDANRFGAVSALAGGLGAVTLSDADGLTLGAVTASTLAVRAGGAIDDGVDGALTIAGDAAFGAGGGDFDILLDNPGAHVIGGAVALEGADVTIAAAALRLGRVLATGDLSAAAAAGDLTDGEAGGGGGSVTVFGDASLSASGDVVLDNPGHLFDADAAPDDGALRDQVGVSAGGDAILTDTDGLAVAGLSAGGAAILRSGGDLALSDAAAATIRGVAGDGGVAVEDIAAGALSLSGAEAIVGPPAPIAGDLTIARAVIGAGGVEAAATGPVSASDLSAIGPVTLSSGGAMAFSALSVGDLEADAGGALTATGLSAGSLRIEAGAVDLADVATGPITVETPGDATLTDLASTGSLVLDAGGAAALARVTGTGAANISAGAGLTLTDIGIDGAAVLTAGGQATGARVAAGGDLSLTASGAAFDVVRGEAIDIALTGAGVFGDVTARGAMNAVADGAAGALSFDALDVAGPTMIGAGGALTLNDLAVADLDAAAAGALAATDVSADDAVLRGGAVAVAGLSGAALEVEADGALAATALTLSGPLGVDAGGDMALTSVTVSGATTASAAGALTITASTFAGLDAAARTATLNGIATGPARLTIAGALDATAMDVDGTLSAGIAGDATFAETHVTGATTLDASALTITASRFAGIDAAARSATLETVTTGDAAFALAGDVAATGLTVDGGFTLEAGGAAVLAQTNVTGATALEAGALAIAGGAFAGLEATASSASLDDVSTGAARLDVANGLAATALDVSGALTATVGGAADLDAVSVRDAAVLDVGALSLSGSRFRSTVDVTAATADISAVTSGAARFDVASGFDASLLSVEGALTADIGGAAAMTDLTVRDAALLTVGGDLAIRDSAFANLGATGGGDVGVETTETADLTLAGDALTLSGVAAAGVELTARGGLTVLDLGATGALTADAAGDIALTRAAAASAAVTGAAGLRAEGLDIAGAGDFAANEATLRGLSVGGAFAARALGDLAIGSAATGDATLVAGGAADIEAARLGAVDLEAARATLDGVAAGAAAFSVAGTMDARDLTAGDLSIDAGAAVLNGVRAVGDLTVDAGTGAVDLTDAAATGRVDLTGGVVDVDRLGADAGLRIAATGAAALSDLAAVSAEIAADAVDLSRFFVGTLSVSAETGLRIAGGEAGAVVAAAGADASVDGVRLGSFDLTAGDDVRIDGAAVVGAVDLNAGRDAALGAVSTGATLRVTGGRDVFTIDSDGVLAPVAIAGAGAIAAPAIETGPPAGVTAPGAAAPATAGRTLAAVDLGGLVTVDGDAAISAGDRVFLVHDGFGAALENDFRGALSVDAGGAVVIESAGDVSLAAPGLIAGGTILVEAGGAIDDGADRAARVVSGGDAAFVAGGDVTLDNGGHAIGGVLAASGVDLNLSEVGSLTLGPIDARSDLTVIAGANGTRGAAEIRQARAVATTTAEVAVEIAGAAAPEAAIRADAGAISVMGAARFATGLDAAATLEGVEGAPRDLVLDAADNAFGARIDLQRIAGDATVVEESAPTGPADPAAASGALAVGAWEVGGSASLTTVDDVVFLGRLTALEDDAPATRLERPARAAPEGQGAAGLETGALRLFIADGERFTIDTTGGLGPGADGGDVRFDRPVDGANGALSLGSPGIGVERRDLGALTIEAGATGEIRFRDFVGAAGPLGDVDLNAGSIFAGFTMAAGAPDADTPAARFLFDENAPDDFFFGAELRLDAVDAIRFATPPAVLEDFVFDDSYFGVNVAEFIVGEAGAPAFVEAFGFIRNTRMRSGGLFPRVPTRSPDFQFNDCEVGDVADCTNVPPPNIVNQILIVAPPVLDVDEEDLLELFGSFGNEELWGVPQSFFSDFADDAEVEPRAENDEDDEDEDEDEGEEQG